METDEPFSDQLERWLGSDEPKTLGGLGDVFGEKSFAVTILFLMFIPALPLPTGGITHVFEAIAALVGAEMVIGAGRSGSPPGGAIVIWATRRRVRRSRSWSGASDGSSGSRGAAGRGCSSSAGSCGWSA